MTPRKKAEDVSEAKPKKSGRKKPVAIENEPVSAPEVAESVETLPKPQDELPEIDRMVVFHLAGQRYAIAIYSVQEIQQIVAFAEISGGMNAVIGMINLRGQVIPAFDMRLLLGLPSQEFHVDTPMIICKTMGQLIALVVDEVEDVVLLPEGCLSPPPRMHSLSDRMIGVCRMGMDLIYLLDIDKMMAPLAILDERRA